MALKELIVPDYPIWRFSVSQYHTMIETGILTEDDAVELLEGWLIPKMPQNPAKSTAIVLVPHVLTGLCPRGWHVRSQVPLTTADSEPEPDTMIVQGSPLDYAERHPKPSEVALVIEIADSTLQRDRSLKQPIYARAAIPLYWVINLVDEQIEVYSTPEGDSYCHHTSYDRKANIALVFAGETVAHIAVHSLLP